MSPQVTCKSKGQHFMLPGCW